MRWSPQSQYRTECCLQIHCPQTWFASSPRRKTANKSPRREQSPTACFKQHPHRQIHGPSGRCATAPRRRLLPMTTKCSPPNRTQRVLFSVTASSIDWIFNGAVPYRFYRDDHPPKLASTVESVKSSSSMNLPSTSTLNRSPPPTDSVRVSTNCSPQKTPPNLAMLNITKFFIATIQPKSRRCSRYHRCTEPRIANAA